MKKKTHGSLVNAFGRTYLINLPERTDRLRSARREFARVGWDGVTVFPACRFDSAGGFQSIGARGCFHSHLACLTRALEDRCGDVLILEDDIMLPSSLPALTPSILRQLRERAWDLAYF